MTDKKNDTAEVLARVRRIETRLWKLCERLEVEPEPGRFEVICGRDSDDIPWVQVHGYDTTLTAIKRALEAGGFDFADESVSVRIGAKEIALLDLFE